MVENWKLRLPELYRKIYNGTFYYITARIIYIVIITFFVENCIIILL